jgi:hypothetical protein
MPSSLSNTTLSNVLDYLYGNTSPPSRGTLYFALFTAAPSASGGGTEVTGGSYARVAVTNNTTNFPPTSGNIKSNGTAIIWPTSTAAWGTLVAWAVYDASSAGNLLDWGLLNTSQIMNSGDGYQLAIGQFTVTF